MVQFEGANFLMRVHSTNRKRYHNKIMIVIIRFVFIR